MGCVFSQESNRGRGKNTSKQSNQRHPNPKYQKRLCEEDTKQQQQRLANQVSRVIRIKHIHMKRFGYQLCSQELEQCIV